MKLFQLSTAAVLFGMIATQATSAEIKMKGDVRLRHEVFYDENKIKAEKDERQRSRYRARINFNAAVNDHVDAGLRLLSGSSDPVSGNQSMGKFGTTKGIGIDRAFIQINSPYGVTFTGGKTANPFAVTNKSELVWDGDYSPEGASLNYELDLGQSVISTTVATAWLIENSSSASDDLMQSGVQINASHKLDGVTFNGGISVVNIHSPNFESGLNGTSNGLDDGDFDSFGNSSANDAHTTNMEIINPYISIALNSSIPISLYGDFVVNQAVDTNNTGYAAGIIIGKAKKPMSFAFKSIYKVVESDATYAPLTDSDFGGGGTGSAGLELGAKLALMENTFFGVSQFINQQIDKDPVYYRTQLDLSVKF